ncbi:MAG TPA: hypothetical protein DCY07_06730 [Rhodospirillaceae bacterium]|nr:hypothetical protein [Rhodospirillaceae bacterium]
MTAPNNSTANFVLAQFMMLQTAKQICAGLELIQDAKGRRVGFKQEEPKKNGNTAPCKIIKVGKADPSGTPVEIILEAGTTSTTPTASLRKEGGETEPVVSKDRTRLVHNILMAVENCIKNKAPAP